MKYRFIYKSFKADICIAVKNEEIYLGKLMCTVCILPKRIASLLFVRLLAHKTSTKTKLLAPAVKPTGFMNAAMYQKSMQKYEVSFKCP